MRGPAVINKVLSLCLPADAILCFMDIFHQAVTAFPKGANLPGTEYIVKGIGKKHGEDAIVYLIPNRKDTTKPSSKRFAASELECAYRQLSSTGEFTRTWFNSAMKECANGAPCNFSAIGAVFVGLNLAERKHALFALNGHHF